MTDMQEEKMVVETQTVAVEVQQPKKKKMLGLAIPGWIIYGVIFALSVYLIYCMFDAVESDRIAREQAAQNGNTAITLGTPLMLMVAIIFLCGMAIAALIPTGLGVGGLVVSLKKKLSKGNVVQFSLMTALPLITCAIAFVAVLLIAQAGGAQIG